MKDIALAAALFAFLAAPFSVFAQTKAPPPAQPAAAAPAQKSAPPAAPAAAAPAAQAKAKPHTTRRPSTADARVCLEFPTNLQVIKCADKYRWAS